MSQIKTPFIVLLWNSVTKDHQSTSPRASPRRGCRECRPHHHLRHGCPGFRHCRHPHR